MILVNLNLNLNGIRSPSVAVHVIAVIIVNLIAIIVVWPFFMFRFIHHELRMKRSFSEIHHSTNIRLA